MVAKELTKGVVVISERVSTNVSSPIAQRTSALIPWDFGIYIWNWGVGCL